MSEMQDALNRILSDPEAMKQVQSLGEQLGISRSNENSEPTKVINPPATAESNDMMRAFSQLAPMMSRFGADDETAALLNALRPFLGEEKRKKLDQAQRLIRLIKMIPLIRDSGMFL